MESDTCNTSELEGMLLAEYAGKNMSVSKLTVLDTQAGCS